MLRTGQLGEGGGGGGVGWQPCTLTDTYTQTHTLPAHKDSLPCCRRQQRPPLVMKGNQAAAWIMTDSSQRTWLPESLRTTMHLRTSHISVETIELENCNSAWKQKKEKELFIVWLDRQKQTINFPYDFSQCYLLVSVKSLLRLYRYTFLIVEMFYSFERCFTLFGLPLYSFPSVGVNRSDISKQAHTHTHTHTHTRGCTLPYLCSQSWTTGCFFSNLL